MDADDRSLSSTSILHGLWLILSTSPLNTYVLIQVQLMEMVSAAWLVHKREESKLPIKGQDDIQ